MFVEPGYTEYRDDDFWPEGTITVWDKLALVQLQGPIRTATYRDELGSNTGMIIRDKWKLAFADTLRIANGGHIITKDSDGNLKVFCKRMFLKKGKKRIPVSHKFHATVTDESVIYVACAVCARFVKVREQLIDYQWKLIKDVGHVAWSPEFLRSAGM